MCKDRGGGTDYIGRCPRFGAAHANASLHSKEEREAGRLPSTAFYLRFRARDRDYQVYFSPHTPSSSSSLLPSCVTLLFHNSPFPPPAMCFFFLFVPRVYLVCTDRQAKLERSEAQARQLGEAAKEKDSQVKAAVRKADELQSQVRTILCSRRHRPCWCCLCYCRSLKLVLVHLQSCFFILWLFLSENARGFLPPCRSRIVYMCVQVISSSFPSGADPDTVPS